MLGRRTRRLDGRLFDRALLDAPFAVAILDRTYHYLCANEPFAALSGLTAAPDARRTVAGIGPPGLWAALEPILGRVLHGETIRDADVRWPDKPFDRRWRVTAYPVRLPDDTSGIALIVDDITTRRTAVRRGRRAADQPAGGTEVGSWHVDLGTGAMHWSAQMFDIFDLPDQEGAVDDEMYLQRVHPDDRDRQVEVQRATRRGMPQDDRFRIVRPDGRVRTVRSIGHVEHDARGRPTRVSGTLQDITERRRADRAIRPFSGAEAADRRRTAKALAESERHLQALAAELATERSHLVAAQAVAKMGSWSTDLQRMTVTWSAETHRIFGTDPATFAPTHQRFLERVHPADRAAVDQALLASLPSRETRTIQHRVDTGDGRVKFVQETWRIVPGDDGTPLRAVGTIQDITERKEAEDRVRASDARLRAVLSNAPVVILAVDTDGTFTMSEGRGLEAAGLTPGQLVGHSASALYGNLDIVRPDGVTVTVHDAVAMVLSGEAVTGLTQLGSEFFENHFVPDVGADGQVAGMIGVSTVVTARRRAELRVQHLNRVYSMLSGINETIVRETDSRRMLEAACRLAVERGEFAMAWIGLTDAAGTLTVTAHAGADADTMATVKRLVGGATTGPGCSFTEHALKTGQTSICNDIARDPLAEPWRAVAGARGYGSMASLPLTVHGAVIGTFNLYAASAAAFDAEELRLLDELAMDIAFGLDVHERENQRRRVDRALRASETRLRRSMSELQAVSARLNEAREQERAAMARDIHDHFGQSLTALKMDIGEVRRRLDAGDTATVRERLAQMSELLDASMDDVRRVAAELRPVVLDDLGFVAAMRAYLIDVEGRARIRCVLRTTLTDLAIANDRATALFRILQEALTNVVRHADASKVDVDLSVESGWVHLVVRDDGHGIPDAAARHPRSLGLIGMRDRARLFGGEVLVTGKPGEGATVTVDLPLDEAPS